MKRILTTVAIITLLVSWIIPCFAETLNIAGLNRSTYTKDGKSTVKQWYEAFKERYPDVQLSIEKTLSSNSTKALISALKKSSFKYDVFVISSDKVDLATLMSSGVLADMSGNSHTAAILDQTHASLIDMVTFDGKVCGMPCNVDPTLFLTWNPKAWTTAGFTECDVPTSFSSFLDFLEAWILRCESDPVDDVCITNEFDEGRFGESSYTLWLMEMLVRNYIRQCEMQQISINFDTDEWRTLAERVRVIGEKLYRADKPFESNLPLFEEYSLSSQLPYYVPSRLYDPDPISIPVCISVMCIPSDADDSAYGFLDVYFACITNRQYDLFDQTEDDSEMALVNALLFKNVNAPVPSANYSAPYYWEGMIEEAQAMIGDPNTSPSQRKYYEANLARYTEKRLVEEAYEQQFVLDEQELIRYQTLASCFVATRPGMLDTGSSTLKKVLRQYAAGKLSTEELVIHLNNYVMLERE